MITLNENNLMVNDVCVTISKELGEYLKKTNGLTDDNIELTTSKTGVQTLKIKSLTYSINGKNKNLNLYKINSNNEGVTKMKVFVKFMKPKDASKRNPFNSLIAKVVKPKLTGEFENMDAVKAALEDAIKELTNENSKWIIEDNTKTAGLVVKNEYKKEGREFPSHNIFFVNVVQSVES